ncbi:hypothetical protein TNCV_2835781 [Trichonephila clavipes]|nr:hypothetical protein TNCV_2835781 [Trichonephila clavipes]
MTLPSTSTLAATIPSTNSVPSVDTLFTLSLLLSTSLFFGQSRLKCLSDPQGTIATYLDMKAVSVLEHFSDHGSIHQKMKKNTTSVRSYPNSAGDGKPPYEEGLVFFT